MRIEPLEYRFSVCKLADWAGVDLDAPFTFTACTDDERSLVCPTDAVPPAPLAREDGWRALRICGELDFSLVGILSAISTALADAGIGLFAVSTFNTDYILVKEQDFERALDVLAAAGFER